MRKTTRALFFLWLLLLLLIFTTLVFSCASNYRRPESVKSKIARYKSKQSGANKVPVINLFDHRFVTKKQVSRVPASIGKQSNGDQAGEKYSNKRLYFLTLLTQYGELKKFSTSTIPDINMCPSFHSSMVGHNELYKKGHHNQQLKATVQINFSKNIGKWTDEYLAIYPELSLPVTKEDIRPRVFDILQGADRPDFQLTLQKALDIHVQKLHGELVTLCEYGSSDNYYIFENLSTHIKRADAFTASSKNMQKLLKTTLFSNMLLLRSLTTSTKEGPSRSISSVKDAQNQYSDYVINRLNVRWSNSYFDELENRKK